MNLHIIKSFMSITVFLTMLAGCTHPLTIESDPNNAEIRYNGTLVGAAPLKIDIKFEKKEHLLSAIKFHGK